MINQRVGGPVAGWGLSRNGSVAASFPLLFQSCSLLRCVPRVSKESSVWERGILGAWVGVSTAAPHLQGSYSPTQVAFSFILPCALPLIQLTGPLSPYQLTPKAPPWVPLTHQVARWGVGWALRCPSPYTPCSLEENNPQDPHVPGLGWKSASLLRVSGKITSSWGGRRALSTGFPEEPYRHPLR